MINKLKRHARDFFVRTGVKKGQERAALVEALERRELMDGTFRAGSNLSFIDSNGSRVTLVLTGPGKGEMFQGQNGDIAELLITDSTLDSKLSIQVDGSGAAVTTWVGAIFIGGAENNVQESIGMIDAPKANVNATIAVQGGINSIVVNRLSSAGVVIAEGVKTGVTIVAGQVTDSSIQVLGPIKTMNIGSWNDTDETPDFLLCQTLGRLYSKGDLDVRLEVTQNAGANRVSVTQIEVLGDARMDTWNINGNVGSIKVGGLVEGKQWDLHGNVATLALGGASGLKIEADKVGSVMIGKLGLAGSTIDLDSAGTVAVKGNLVDSILTFNASKNTQGSGFKTAQALRLGGDITGSTVSITGSVSILDVGGDISGSTVSITGPVSHFNAGGDIAGSTVSILGPASVINVREDITGSLMSVAGPVRRIQVDGTAGGTLTIDGQLETFLARATDLLSLAADKVTNIHVGSGGMRDSTVSSASANLIRVDGELFRSTLDLDGSVGMMLLTKILSSHIRVGGDLKELTGLGSFQSDLSVAGRVSQLTIRANVEESTISMGSLGVGKLFVRDQVSITVNKEGTARELGRKAIDILEMRGTISSFKLDCSGQGSDVGTIRSFGPINEGGIHINGSLTSGLFGGIESAYIQVSGKVHSLKFTGDVHKLDCDFPDLGALELKGNASRIDVRSKSLGSFLLTKDMADSYLYFGTDDTTQVSQIKSIRILGKIASSNFTVIHPLTLADLYVREIGSGGQFNIHGKVERIRIGNQSSASQLRVANQVTSLTTDLGVKIQGALRFDRIGTISINGSMSGAMVQVPEGIGFLSVTGDVENTWVSSEGSIGSISVGSLRNTSIYAGYFRDAPVAHGRPSDTSLFVNANAQIGSVVVKSASLDGGFVNSTLASPILGTVRLTAVETRNDGNIMGLFALSRIKQVSLRAGPVLKDLTGTGVKKSLNDFRIEILEVVPPVIVD